MANQQYLYAYAHSFGALPCPQNHIFQAMEKYLGVEVHGLNWNVPTFAETTTTHSLEFMEEYLDKNSRAAGGKKWNVVGSSYGAFLFATLSNRRPDLFHKIILLVPAFDTLSYLVEHIKQYDWSPDKPQNAEFVEKNRTDNSGPLSWKFMEDIYANFLLDEAQNPPVNNPTAIVACLEDEMVPLKKITRYIKKNFYGGGGFVVQAHILPPTDDPESQKLPTPNHGLYHFTTEDSKLHMTFQHLLQSFFKD